MYEYRLTEELNEKEKDICAFTHKCCPPPLQRIILGQWLRYPIRQDHVIIPLPNYLPIMLSKAGSKGARGYRHAEQKCMM